MSPSKKDTTWLKYIPRETVALLSETFFVTFVFSIFEKN